MRHKILVSDRDFTELQELQDIANNVNWGYNRIGGCGAFSFTVPERFCRETTLGGNFNVKIYRRNPSTSAYDLWYQGRIENKVHDIRGPEETIIVTGSGYQSELSKIYVDRDYSSQEISVIVKDILDNDITPNTNITYDAGDIAATTFTPDSLSFNTTADKVFETLADITGTREWGVDKDRKFFFKARSTSVGFYVPFNDKVLNYSQDNSSSEIVNRVIVRGDGNFVRVVNDAQSQLKWKRQDKPVNNSAITTNAVADQLGEAIFAEFNDIVRRARISMLDEQLYENTIPIGLFRLLPKLDTYGTRRYQTGLYSGYIDHQIQRIQYQINDGGAMIIDLELGQLRPNIAETISRIEFELEQVSQRGI